MILSELGVQPKGFDCRLSSTTKRLMAACRSTTLLKAALEMMPGEGGEEALDGVEPTAGGGREWNVQRDVGPAGFTNLPTLSVFCSCPLTSVSQAIRDDDHGPRTS
jgi:hypothetical protein